MSSNPPHPIPVHQPIHQSSTSHSQHGAMDYPMSSTSWNGSNSGSFNPASYTRHFLGSPISWRAGSFVGAPSGSPMDQIRGSLESRGLDPEISNAFKVFDLQDQLCRNYTCCGLNLTDLHALLEHFEQVHIVVVDAPGPGGQPQTRIQVPFDPQVVSVQPNQNQNTTQIQNQNQNSTQNHYPTPVDPDDMELEPSHPAPTSPTTSHSSSGASSPPVSTPSSLAAAGVFPNTGFTSYSHSHPSSPYTSQPPSPPHAFSQNHGVAAFDTTRIPAFQPSSSSLAGAVPSVPAQGKEGRRPSLSLNLNGMDGVESTTANNVTATNPAQAQTSGYSTPTSAFPTAYAYSQPPHPQQHPHPAHPHPFAYNHSGAGSGTMTPLSPLSPAPMSPMSSFPSALAAALVEPGSRSSTSMGSIAAGVMGGVPGDGTVTPAMLFSNNGTPEPDEEASSFDASREEDGEEGVDGSPDSTKSKTKLPKVTGKDTKSSKKKKSSGKGADADPTKPVRSVGRPPNPSIPPAIPNSLKSQHGLFQTSSSALSSVHATGLGAGSGSGLGAGLGAAGLSGLLGASKPFKCPKPNCNKSYKQANGLKYHITHGSCNFAPPKDLEHVQALLERKRKDRAAQLASSTSHSTTNSTTDISQNATAETQEDDVPGSGWTSPGGTSSAVPTAPSSPTAAHSTSFQSDPNLGSGSVGDLDLGLDLSEQELLALSLEAEKKLKPFACGVGDCTRRYKNMNGLRYHYAHTGEHGAIGLAMLASGVHECLQNNHHSSHHSSHHSKSSPGSGGKEREGRKVRGVGSKPPSRASSITRGSRTGTPLGGGEDGTSNNKLPPPPQATSFAAAQIRELNHAHSASSLSSPTSPGLNSTPTPTPGQLQAQYHAQQQVHGLAQALGQGHGGYQQRFMEHQRAQYVAQQMQQQQQGFTG
ncbi:hypothetical protein VKT23_015764 [Stygiomarasmius scandens]|uniref:C2H2-type domain-containing protein n=1 Tax=Marasmiellus scandens TaxID=2682957 RepID=A0ABR1J0Y5_9AGAR